MTSLSIVCALLFLFCVLLSYGLLNTLDRLDGLQDEVCSLWKEIRATQGKAER